MFKNINSQIVYLNELTMIRMGYIFADKMTVVSFNFNYLQALIDFDSTPEAQLVKDYMIYYKEDKKLITQEVLDLNYNALKRLRNEKGKRKESIIQHQKLERWIGLITADVYKYLNHYVTQNKERAFLGFVEDGSLKLINHEHEDTDYLAKMIQQIIDSFINNDAVHFFDEYAFEDAQDIKPEENVDELPGIVFTTNTLISIPDLSDFTYNQLRIIKNEFNELFRPLHVEINRWMKEMYDVKYDFNEKNRDDYDAFEKLLTFEKVLNDAQNQNIYFQSIRQSNPDNKFRDLRYGISSLSSAINIYRKSRIINKEEEAYILEKVGKVRDLNSLCFFLYHKLSKEKEAAKEPTESALP